MKQLKPFQRHLKLAGCHNLRELGGYTNSAGKDRTGIIIALLLAVVNVPVATIAEDYQLSDRYLAPLYSKIREQAIKEGFAHLLKSPPQIIIDIFAYLDQNYGEINNYLENIAINLEIRNRLKTMLVK